MRDDIVEEKKHEQVKRIGPIGERLYVMHAVSEVIDVRIVHWQFCITPSHHCVIDHMEKIKKGRLRYRCHVRGSSYFTHLTDWSMKAGRYGVQDCEH